jgi:hypothetical protein
MIPRLPVTAFYDFSCRHPKASYVARQRHVGQHASVAAHGARRSGKSTWARGRTFATFRRPCRPGFTTTGEEAPVGTLSSFWRRNCHATLRAWILQHFSGCRVQRQLSRLGQRELVLALGQRRHAAPGDSGVGRPAAPSGHSGRHRRFERQVDPASVDVERTEHALV